MQRQVVFARAAWPLLCLLLAAAPAWAQSDPDDRPWAAGVSPEDQEVALALFAEGNALLKDSLFLPAVEKYREALRHWEHPGIHYNLALALLNLDQPIEVYRSLTKALEYGVAPLDDDKHERAQSYLKLVEKQLAWVEIVCDLPDAKVTMGGRLLFTGPGRYEGLVRVGEHNIVATRRGYITENKQIALSPGERERVEIRLFTVDEMTVSKRRWAEWKPWTVAGAGAVVALAGGVVHWRAASNFDSFDRQFNRICGDRGGCKESEVPNLTDQLHRAELQQSISVTSYIVGGTAVATGLVLVYLNRPQLLRKDVEAEEPARVSFAPMLSPGVAGMRVGFRF